VILVDTSVWVEFFKGTARSRALADLLEADEVLLHPWVLGELVLGGLARGHDAQVADLRQLPPAPVVAESEVIELILSRGLSAWREVPLPEITAVGVPRAGKSANLSPRSLDPHVA
jgi:predicted nucleic acid-binding protein